MSDTEQQIQGTQDVINEVMAERMRQRSAEGWTDAHDDEYRSHELAVAAACYALKGAGFSDKPESFIGHWWPWDNTWWKPKNPRRDLIRAAALIVAEIERLDRRSSIRSPHAA